MATKTHRHTGMNKYLTHTHKLYYRCQIHRNAEAIVPNTGTQKHWYTDTKEHTEPEILEHKELAQKMKHTEN